RRRDRRALRAARHVAAGEPVARWVAGRLARRGGRCDPPAGHAPARDRRGGRGGARGGGPGRQGGPRQGGLHRLGRERRPREVGEDPRRWDALGPSGNGTWTLGISGGYHVGREKIEPNGGSFETEKFDTHSFTVRLGGDRG